MVRVGGWVPSWPALSPLGQPPQTCPSAWPAPALQAATPRKDGRHSSDGDFWHIPQTLMGENHLGCSEPLDQAVTPAQRFLGCRDGPVGGTGRKPPKTHVSLTPHWQSPSRIPPNHQKASPSLSFRFLLFVFKFLIPAFSPPSPSLGRNI